MWCLRYAANTTFFSLASAVCMKCAQHECLFMYFDASYPTFGAYWVWFLVPIAVVIFFPLAHPLSLPFNWEICMRSHAHQYIVRASVFHEKSRKNMRVELLWHSIWYFIRFSFWLNEDTRSNYIWATQKWNSLNAIFLQTHKNGVQERGRAPLMIPIWRYIGMRVRFDAVHSAYWLK